MRWLGGLVCACALWAHPGSGIVVDREGNVYFTDTGCCIWKLDPQGRLARFHDSSFHWLGLDAEGRFATTAPAVVPVPNGEFRRITARGVLPALVSSSDYPITFDAAGHIYYLPYRRDPPHELVRMSPDGRIESLVAIQTAAWVNGIAASPGGTIYFTENSVVRRLQPGGRTTVVAEVPACSSPLEPRLGPYLRGLAVDGDGIIYVASTGCRSVMRITPGKAITVLAVTSEPWSPTGIALHDGDVYLLEYDHTGPERTWPPRVRKISPDGEVRTLVTVGRDRASGSR